MDKMDSGFIKLTNDENILFIKSFAIKAIDTTTDYFTVSKRFFKNKKKAKFSINIYTFDNEKWKLCFENRERRDKELEILLIELEVN